MARTKLQRLYQKKKRLLDQAEARARFALAHTRKEAQLETELYARIKRLEIQLEQTKKDVDAIALLHGKRHSQNHYKAQLSDQLHAMTTTHQEAKELLTGLRSIKKHGVKNIHGLARDFKKISGLRRRMEGEIELI